MTTEPTPTTEELPVGVLRAHLEAVARIPDVPDPGCAPTVLTPATALAYLEGWRAASEAARRAARGGAP